MNVDKVTFKKIISKISITVVPLVFIIVIDQLSKNWARTLLAPIHYGILKFDLLLNSGIVLGYFSELPINVKEVVLITIGTFILMTYLLSLWLLPIKSKFTYLGLSILVGGIMGNVLDRINGFVVVDFFSIDAFNMNLPFLNLADISQWLAYGFIFMGLYQDSLYYWPNQDWRNKYITNSYFQIRASFLIAFFAFFASIVTLAFSYAFLKNNQTVLILKYFLFIGILISLIFSTFTFLIALVLTHRVAGPFYAIQRHVRHLLIGKNVRFKLREHDEFKEIEKDLNLLSEKISTPEK